MKLFKKEILLALVTLGSMASMAVGTTVAYAQDDGNAQVQIVNRGPDGAPVDIEGAPFDWCGVLWKDKHPEDAQWIPIPFSITGLGGTATIYHGSADPGPPSRPHGAICADGAPSLDDLLDPSSQTPEPCSPANLGPVGGNPIDFNLWVYWPGGPVGTTTEDTFWVALSNGTLYKVTYEMKWLKKNKYQCITTDASERMVF